MNNTSPATVQAQEIVKLLNHVEKAKKYLNEAREVAHISKQEGLTSEEAQLISAAAKVAENAIKVQQMLQSASPAVRKKVAALSALQVVKPA